MADARSMSPALADAFRVQARAGASMGSPFMARLCGLLAEHGLPQSATRDTMNQWSGNLAANGEALPVRLCAALHELVLAEADPELRKIYPPHHEGHDDTAFLGIVADAIERNDDFLLMRMANPPQTNEIRRSSAVYAALLHIAAETGQPLRLSEVGASAGLNLIMHRFGHSYGDTHRGAVDSPVRLAPRWKGSPPPQAQLEITEYRGCDLMPFDLSTPEDRLRLLSYNWADQDDRIKRMRAAIGLARTAPPVVDRADAVDWLRQRLEHASPGKTHVVYHTIAWQYLPESAQEAGQRLIEAAGERATKDAPLHHVCLEMDDRSPGAGLHHVSWPGGRRVELARVDSHGRWIDWH